MAYLRSFLPFLLLSLAVSGCGLIKAPFRVAGGLANGAYQGGKKVSNSFEQRRLRKEHEKEEIAKKEARKPGKASASGEIVPGPTAPPTEGPIIPLGEPAVTSLPAPEPALPQ
jgi:hypothetical protein